MTDVAQKLQVLHRLAHRAWAQTASTIGLSHSEFEYLAAIHAEAAVQYAQPDAHGQHLHDIVARLGVSKASASAMVTKLEARALITRVVCKMDARAQHIILTDAGRALLRKGEGVYEAVAADLPEALARSLPPAARR